VLAIVLATPPVVRAADSTDWSEVYARLAPTVVEIYTRERAPDRRRPAAEVSVEGLGSGVLIEGGRILTAAHVVQTADTLRVLLADGTQRSAIVVASSPDHDVAMLQLDTAPAPTTFARLGHSDHAKIGEPVLVIGAPFGLERSFTAGHLSGRRVFGDSDRSALAVTELLQTDAAINRGNSGGPLFNARGEVIGIVSQILSQSGGFEGIGFATSIDTARRVLLEERLFWTGVSFVTLTGELAHALNLPAPAGLLVQRVARGSPADALGLLGGSIPAEIDSRPLLLGGDIVVGVDGLQFDETRASGDAILRLLSRKQPGEAVRVRVVRGGKLTELVTTLVHP
jgi:S1-C subfamily serine protease